MKPAYQITREDCENEARFDDVVFEAVHGLRHPDGEDTPYELWDVVMQYRHNLDWPYRQFLPQKVEGLVCAGRASIIQPPVLRMRFQMLMCGEAVGRAAALSMTPGVRPQDLELPHNFSSYGRVVASKLKSSRASLREGREEWGYR